jgi:hypothetical protein
MEALRCTRIDTLSFSSRIPLPRRLTGYGGRIADLLWPPTPEKLAGDLRSYYAMDSGQKQFWNQNPELLSFEEE